MEIKEEAMDVAISEALGIGEVPAEYQAGGEGAARRAGREMRETVARLAAASPHMKPSPELRARILEASAPRTYKLEDYRKVGSEDMRWYKWGFYAAAAFLILGAMYNISVSGKLETARREYAAQYADLATKANALVDANQKQQAVVSALVDPRSAQITWNDPQTNKPVFRATVNGGVAVMIVPQELLPQGVPLQLTLTENGKAVTLQTTVLTASAKDLGLTLPANYQEMAKDFAKRLSAPQQLKPGEPGKPFIASKFP